MSTIFISYSRKDKDIATELYNDITAVGYDAWIDNDLSGGESWWNLILENIRNNDVFILILSPDSLKSTACKREYKYAYELKKPIIPVQVKKISIPLLPIELSELQIEDYLSHDKDEILRLIKAINNIKKEPLPNPLPTPPDIPISYMGKVTQKIESDSLLDYEKQTFLLAEIKRHINNKNNNKSDIVDITYLLKKFRQRRDLYAYTADDIDYLLNKNDPNESLDRNVNQVIEENVTIKQDVKEFLEEKKQLLNKIKDLQGELKKKNDTINDLNKNINSLSHRVNKSDELLEAFSKKEIKQPKKVDSSSINNKKMGKDEKYPDKKPFSSNFNFLFSEKDNLSDRITNIAIVLITLVSIVWLIISLIV